MKPHSVYIAIILAILTILTINIREKNRLYEETKGIEILKQTVDRLQLMVDAQYVKWKADGLEQELRWLYTVMALRNEKEIKKLRR